jgi:hypothetical protein
MFAHAPVLGAATLNLVFALLSETVVSERRHADNTFL